MPDLTDDQITDAIAAEVASRLQASHPMVTAPMRKRLVKLYTAQAVGIVPPPGRITDAQLGQYLGSDHRRISETRHRAIERLKANPRHLAALAEAWPAYHPHFRSHI